MIKSKNRIEIMMIGIVGIITFISILAYNSKKMTDTLSNEMIRFHVVANSDTTEDQLLKQQVKDEIIHYMEPLLKDSKSIDETRKIVNMCLPNIKNVSQEVVKKYGMEYNIYVSLDKANFPTKAYGDVILPAGEYEACRVIIGEGKGENWWCVMYPPLCYIDIASGVVPLEGKEQLRQNLNEEQYKLVVQNKEKKYVIRFKIVDTINSVICKDNYKKKKSC